MFAKNVAAEINNKYFKLVSILFICLFSLFPSPSFFPIHLSPLPRTCIGTQTTNSSRLSSACSVYLVIFGSVCNIFQAQLRVVAHLLLTPSSHALYLAFSIALDGIKLYKDSWGTPVGNIRPLSLPCSSNTHICTHANTHTWAYSYKYIQSHKNKRARTRAHAHAHCVCVCLSPFGISVR